LRRSVETSLSYSQASRTCLKEKKAHTVLVLYILHSPLDLLQQYNQYFRNDSSLLVSIRLVVLSQIDPKVRLIRFGIMTRESNRSWLERSSSVRLTTSTNRWKVRVGKKSENSPPPFNQ